MIVAHQRNKQADYSNQAHARFTLYQSCKLKDIANKSVQNLEAAMLSLRTFPPFVSKDSDETNYPSTSAPNSPSSPLDFCPSETNKNIS